MPLSGRRGETRADVAAARHTRPGAVAAPGGVLGAPAELA